MDMLFSALWRKARRRGGTQEAGWLHQPAFGCARLLAAVTVIGALVCLLDHTAAGMNQTDILVASSEHGS